MKEQTIYSYKLLRRFRWRLAGWLFQLLLICLFPLAASVWLKIPADRLVVTLAVLPAIAAGHLCLFRLYAGLRSHHPHTTPDLLVSPWWGAGSRHPVSLRAYRGAEATVLAGSLFLAAAVFVWVPLPYGMALLWGTAVLGLPRLLALIASLRQPPHCRVKYESGSVAFLLTDG
ncbi:MULTISPECIES: hypothetical protein [Brevibacillus]|jgi:hypothetical protein|uniref:hypothetical protein n=1 Tax=Brevibacillus TaxID=55080 RepID=UPI001492AD44|nr:MULTISPECIES: hypothetical protein [Brevibacillus]MBR8659913.1 hypothetical protein [Brevibacillus sp. NL20B1]MDT3416860.1 hypothetical protein [Brevibacillus aydinogluensis]NNV04380.1 hypothetical protein [Brevibacillus sp. MCWH]